MEAMFKIGDRVRIRSDIKEMGRLGVTERMHRYAGMEATITRHACDCNNAFILDVDGGDWVWMADTLMPLPVQEDAVKDSGDRTKYPSGAVRDMKSGKGRCDLLPIEEIADMLESGELSYIASFKETGDVQCLRDALACAADGWFISGSAEANTASMLLEVAKHFEAGAEKYGDRNWEKGIPVHSFIDSAVRHYLKHEAGWRDERHDRAFCWNVLCCIWTMKHHPELDDFTDPARDDKVVEHD